MTPATLPVEAATRAEAPAPAVRYRLATDADGPAIGALFQAADLNDLGVDWTAPGVGGWWLVAEKHDDLVGAIQVCAARPFGFIGDIVVHPSARARHYDGTGRLSKRPGTVGFSLYVFALDLLKRLGCQRVLGVTNKPGLAKMLTRYGGVDLGEHTLFARDLTDWKGLGG